MEKKKCRHRIFQTKCRSCKRLQEKWYGKLKAHGFVDIEYGLDCPSFTARVVDPNVPHAEASRRYYELAWQVFHAWVAQGRPKRDCRVAELFAGQQGKSGTIRGISKVLKDEKLSPFSPGRVQRTVKEIHQSAILLSESVTQLKPIDPAIYISPKHKAA